MSEKQQPETCDLGVVGHWTTILL